ncbi:unnamed protein product [Zymoseptoria tritici ST99CH_1E4]|uniref:Uncharacterized protein n=1 Tax=Zymoseptoria tritici ST99CH_1E4 TaxID=1276532 RepID=A0A2H1FWT5_ZYMTR|nr:unnamed protein product [Zymoseptoria tritici ST99CH_1E4]
MKLTTFSMALIAASIDLAMATNDICCINTLDPRPRHMRRWNSLLRKDCDGRIAEPLLFSLRASSTVRSRVEDTLLNALLKVNRANRSVSPSLGGGRHGGQGDEGLFERRIQEPWTIKHTGRTLCRSKAS